MLLGGRPQGRHDFYPEGVCAHLFFACNVLARPGGGGPQLFPADLCARCPPRYLRPIRVAGINPRVDRCSRQYSRAARVGYSLRIVVTHAVCVLVVFVSEVSETFVALLTVS